MIYKRKKRILFSGEFSGAYTGYGCYYKNLLSRIHSLNKYEIAEFASFVAINDQRDSHVKWKLYCNEPSPNDQVSQQQYNSNDINKCGMYRFDKVLLDFNPDIVCVPPGKLVLTETGYKAIEEINIGERVYTHKGRFKKVTKTFKRNYNGNLQEIKCIGANNLLKLTPEHPVLIYKKPKHGKYSWKTIYENVEPIFVPSKELKKGDKIVFPCSSENSDLKELDITDFLTNFKLKDGQVYPFHIKKNENGINRFIKIDKDLGEIIGTIIGDGSLKNNDRSINITFNITEKHFAERIVCLIKNSFNIDAKIFFYKNRNACFININSCILKEFLTKILTKDKSCFRFDLLNNNDFIKGVIKGLIRSDGCYKKNTVSFTNCNKKIAYLYRALTSFIKIPTNLQSKIAKSPASNLMVKSFDVEGYGSSAESLHQIAHKKEKIIGNKNSNNRKTQLINDKYIISSIVTNKSRKYEGVVYNLEVEEDNSYCVEQYCVHNCEIRDTTTFSYQMLSPLRKFFSWIVSPSLDSSPQISEWISTLLNADKVLTYSDYAQDVLKKEGGNKIKLFKTAYPGADFDVFRPLQNKQALRSSFGINPEAFIVSMNGRSQLRKMFIEIIKGFRIYLDKIKYIDPNLAKNSLLYLHTTQPDLKTWNVTKALVQYGLTNNTLFTYNCTKCGRFFPNSYQETITNCRYCGGQAILPRVNFNINAESLNQVYNLTDVYVQYANRGATEFPIIEAAAAGCNIMAVDYAGTGDTCRRLNGIPLKVLATPREINVDADAAIPCNEFFADKLVEFAKRPRQINIRNGIKTAELTRKKCSWDINAQIWEEAIDSMVLKGLQGKWYSKINYQPRPIQENSATAIWVYDLIEQALQEPHLKHSLFADEMIKHCEAQLRSNGNGVIPWTRKEIADVFNNMINHKLAIEAIRSGQQGLPKEDWIKYAETKNLTNL